MDDAATALFTANQTSNETYTIPSPPTWVNSAFAWGGKGATMTAMAPQGGLGGLLADDLFMHKTPLPIRVPTDIFFAFSAMIGKFAIVNYYNDQAFRDSPEGQKWADWFENLKDSPSQILNHIWSFAPSGTFAFLGAFGMKGCASLLKKLYLSSSRTMDWAAKAAPFFSNPYMHIPFMFFPFLTNLMGFTHIQNSGVDFIKGALNFAAENPEYRELREDIARKLEAVRESVRDAYEEGTRDLREAFKLLDMMESDVSDTETGRSQYDKGMDDIENAFILLDRLDNLFTDNDRKSLTDDLAAAKNHYKNEDIDNALTILEQSRQLSDRTQQQLDHVIQLIRQGKTKRDQTLLNDLRKAQTYIKNGNTDTALSVLSKNRSNLSPLTQQNLTQVAHFITQGQTKLKKATDLLDRIKPEEKTIEQIRETLLKEFHELQLTGASPEPFYRKHAAGLIAMGLCIWGLTNFISFAMAASYFFRGESDDKVNAILTGEDGADVYAEIMGGMTFCSMMAMATGTYDSAASMVDDACNYRRSVDILSSNITSSTAGDIASAALVGVACVTGVTPNVDQSIQAKQGIPASLASAFASFALEVKGFWELIKKIRLKKALSSNPLAKRIYEADQKMLDASNLKKAKAEEVHTLATNSLPEISEKDEIQNVTVQNESSPTLKEDLIEVHDNKQEQKTLLPRRFPQEYRHPLFGEIAAFWNKPLSEKVAPILDNMKDGLVSNNTETRNINYEAIAMLH